jgi:hypothetical protein
MWLGREFQREGAVTEKALAVFEIVPYSLTIPYIVFMT